MDTRCGSEQGFKKEFLKPLVLCAWNREKMPATALQPRKITAYKASALPVGNRYRKRYIQLMNTHLPRSQGAPIMTGEQVRASREADVARH